MATHSNILAWRIPWTEEPGGLSSIGSQRIGNDWVKSLSHLRAIKPQNLLSFTQRESGHSCAFIVYCSEFHGSRVHTGRYIWLSSHQPAGSCSVGSPHRRSVSKCSVLQSRGLTVCVYVCVCVCVCVCVELWWCGRLTGLSRKDNISDSSPLQPSLLPSGRWMIQSGIPSWVSHLVGSSLVPAALVWDFPRSKLWNMISSASRFFGRWCQKNTSKGVKVRQGREGSRNRMHHQEIPIVDIPRT